MSSMRCLRMEMVLVMEKLGIQYILGHMVKNQMITPNIQGGKKKSVTDRTN